MEICKNFFPCIFFISLFVKGISRARIFSKKRQSPCGKLKRRGYEFKLNYKEETSGCVLLSLA